MSGPLMALLRLVHIVAGIFWVGSTLVLAGFLIPAIRAVGPSAGPLMSQLMRQQRLQRWINISMALAILAGLVLFAMDSRAGGAGFGRSPMGMALGVGALLAIIAAGVDGAMGRRAARKLGDLAQQMESQRGGGAPPAELVAQTGPLQARLARALTISAWLLLLSASAMAVARYL